MENYLLGKQIYRGAPFSSSCDHFGTLQSVRFDLLLLLLFLTFSSTCVHDSRGRRRGRGGERAKITARLTPQRPPEEGRRGEEGAEKKCHRLDGLWRGGEKRNYETSGAICDIAKKRQREREAENDRKKENESRLFGTFLPQ